MQERPTRTQKEAKAFFFATSGPMADYRNEIFFSCLGYDDVDDKVKYFRQIISGEIPISEELRHRIKKKSWSDELLSTEDKEENEEDDFE